ncbi:MFS transporter [Peptococcaceae bacterium 1198_IL3148]
MSDNKTSISSKMHPKVLMLLSAGHLVTDMAAGALPILLPIIQSGLNLSYGAAGFISLVFNFSSSIIQPLLGFWSDKVKSRWLLPMGCLLSMFGLALAGVVSSYGLVLAVVLISGLGSASYHPEASKVSRLASGHRLTTGMSLFTVGGALGAALGSLIMAQLLNIYDRQASAYFIIPGIMMAVLFFLLNSKLPDDPQPTGKHNINVKIQVPRRVIVSLVILILVIIVRSWTQAGLTYFMPLYFVNYLGESPAYASTFLVSFMIAGAAGTVIGGPLADYFGRKKYLVGSTAILIPLLLIIKFVTGFWLMVTLFITGMVIVSTMATTVVMGQELLPHRIGVASGLMTGFAVGMGGLGVTFLGTITDIFGAPTAFTALSLFPILAFILSLFLPNDNDIRKINKL